MYVIVNGLMSRSSTIAHGSVVEDSNYTRGDRALTVLMTIGVPCETSDEGGR